MREILMRITGDASGVVNALRQFQSAMSQAGAVVRQFLGSLAVRVNPAQIFNPITASARTMASVIQQTFAGIQQTVGSFTRSMVNVGRSFFFIREITTGIRGFSLALGNSFAGIETQYENFQLRMTAVLSALPGIADPSAEADKRIRQLEVLNRTTALTTAELVELDIQLTQGRLHSREWVEAIADMSIVLGGDVGANAERLGAAVTRLAAGDGSASAIKSLTEVIKAFGRTELTERGLTFGADGSIQQDANKTLEVILDIFKDRTEAIRAEMANTWEAILSNAKDSFQQLQRVFQGPLAEALKPIFKQIPAIINDPQVMAAASILGQMMVRAGTTVVNAFIAMGNGISQAYGIIYGVLNTVTGGFRTFVGMVGAALAPLRGLFSAIWAGDFGQAGTIIGTALGNIGKIILGNLAGIANQMRSGGGNIIAAFAQGIYDAATTVVVQAVTFVGNLISSFLRGFSPPEQGPLSTIDTWFPPVVEAYLGSWNKADFSALTDLTDSIADAFEGLVERGAASIKDAERIVIGSDGMPGLNRLVMDAMNQIVESGTVSGDTFGSITNLLGEKYGSVLGMVTRTLEGFKLDRQIREVEAEIEALRALGDNDGKMQDALDYAQKKLRDARTYRDFRAAKEQVGLIKSQKDANKDQAKALQNQIRLLKQQKDAIEDVQSGYEAINKLLDREQSFLENINKKEKERKSEAERLAEAQFRYELSIASSSRRLELLRQKLDSMDPNKPEFYAAAQEYNALVQEIGQKQRDYAFSLMSTEDQLESLRKEQGYFNQGSIEYIELQQQIDELEKERSKNLADLAKQQWEFDLQQADSVKQRTMLEQRLGELDATNPEQAQEVFDIRQRLNALSEEEADLREQVNLAGMTTAQQIEYYQKQQQNVNAGSREDLELQLKLIQLREQLANEQERAAKAGAGVNKAFLDAEAELHDINGKIELYRAHLETLDPTSKEYANTLKKIHQLENQREKIQARMAKAATSQHAQLFNSQIGLMKANGDIEAAIQAIDDELAKGNLTEIRRNQLLTKRAQLMKQLEKQSGQTQFQGVMEDLGITVPDLGPVEQAVVNAQKKLDEFTASWTTFRNDGKARLAQVEGYWISFRNILTSTGTGLLGAEMFSAIEQGARNLPRNVAGAMQTFRELVSDTFAANRGKVGETIFDLFQKSGSSLIASLSRMNVINGRTTVDMYYKWRDFTLRVRRAMTDTVAAVGDFFTRVSAYSDHIVVLLRAGDWRGIGISILRQVLEGFGVSAARSNIARFIVDQIIRGNYEGAGRGILNALFDASTVGEVVDRAVQSIKDRFKNATFGNLMGGAAGGANMYIDFLPDSGALSGPLQQGLRDTFGNFDWQAILASWPVQIGLMLATIFLGIQYFPLLRGAGGLMAGGLFGGFAASIAAMSFIPFFAPFVGSITAMFGTGSAASVAVAHFTRIFGGIRLALAPLTAALPSVTGLFTRFGGILARFGTFLLPVVLGLGRMIVPARLIGVVLRMVSGVLLTLTLSWATWGGTIMRYVGPLLSFGRVILGFLPSLSSLGTLFRSLMLLIGPLASLFGPLLGALAPIAAPILLIGGALALLAMNVPIVDETISWLIGKLPEFVNAIVGFFALIVNYIGQNLPGIIDKLGGWISEIGPPLLSGLASMVGILIAAIIQYGPAILQSLAKWGMVFVTWVGSLWTKYVQPNIMPFLTKLLGWIASQAVNLGKTLGGWASQFASWLPGALGRFLAAWPGMLDRFLVAVGNGAGPLLVTLGKWAISFIAWVAPMIPKAILALGGLVLAIVAWLALTAVTIAGRLLLWTAEFLVWAGGLYGKMSASLAGFALKLVKWVSGMATDIGNGAYNLGRDLVQGFVKGFEGMSKWLVGKLTSWVKNNVPAPIKKVLGIESPSKVMAAEVGVPIAQGVAAGIDQGKGTVVHAMEGLGEAAVGALDGEAIGAAAGEKLTKTLADEISDGSVAPRDAMKKMGTSLFDFLKDNEHAFKGSPAGDRVIDLMNRINQLAADDTITNSDYADQFSVLARDLRTNLEMAFGTTTLGTNILEYLNSAQPAIKAAQAKVAESAAKTQETAVEAVKDPALGDAARDNAGTLYEETSKGTKGSAQLYKEMSEEVQRLLAELTVKIRESGVAMGAALKEGLNQGFTDLVNFIKERLAEIANLFPHSEPKDHTSPLAGITEWGGDITKTIAAGLNSPELKEQMAAALGGLQQQLDSSKLALAFEASGAVLGDMRAEMPSLSTQSYAPTININGSGLDAETLQRVVQDALTEDRYNFLRSVSAL